MIDKFLDLEKKVWVIKDLVLPVREVPMKDLRWFKEKMKEANKLQQSQELTPIQALEFDEEWWEKTCQVGLGKSKTEIEDTGLLEPEFRQLMAEVYHFLVTFGSIEGAKLSGFYDQKTTPKE
jgi:hypothetical protein